MIASDRGTGPGPRRHRARLAAVVVLIVVAMLWGINRWVQPIPPHRLVMTTGLPGGTYAAIGERYREVLARDHIRVELRPSSGSVENLRHLQDRSTPVEVGLVQGGISGPEAPAGLVSLGGMFYTPSWIFYRGAEVLDDLSQLAGKRLAIGPEGSGSQKFALDLLRATGAAGPSTVLVELTGRAAADALLRGEIDAVIVFGGPEGPTVREMLRDPGIRLMSFSQADAYAHLFPALSHVVLPMGTIDLAHRLPRADVHLLAPTTNLVVRDTVHPALIYLLLDAAAEVHGGPGLLHHAGEFPAPKTQDLRLSEHAQRFYRTGRPFLRNYLPFWVATFVDRIALLLLPILALLIPVIGISPWLYTWRNRSRIYRSYGELNALEIRMAAEPERAAEHEATLDRIEATLLRMRVPLAFATYDPKDRIFIIGNQNDEPSFTTMVSTKPGHKIIGKVTFPDATDGNEQPTYNPADGLVYQSIPELNKDEKKGAVAVLNPRTATLVKMLAVDNCNPAGLAFGPNGNFVLGCNADGNKMPAIITIMNWKTGKVVANIPDIGGADMVDYNKKNNQYYIAARALKGGPVLGVIDAKTNKLVQKISITGGNPHSVASSEANGHVFLPVGSPNGGCGCIQVYAPQ